MGIASHNGATCATRQMGHFQENCEPTEDRTRDTFLKREVLYQLSYRLWKLSGGEVFFFGSLGLVDESDVAVCHFLDLRLGLETFIFRDSFVFF
jgi:hypothetical protein